MGRGRSDAEAPPEVDEGGLRRFAPTIQRRQRARTAKRLLLGPVAAVVRPWALRAPVSPAKAAACRHVLVPASVAADRPFERDVDLGFRFRGTTGDLIALYIHLFGVWEPHLTTFLVHRLRPGDVFVDVGAHAGWFTLVGATAVGPTGSVVAVEASPLTASKLAENVLRNGLGNVEVVVAAAAGERGDLVVSHGPAEHTGLTRTTAAGPGIRVPAAPLVDLVGEARWRAARVVKIDVEGGEYDVVQGLAPRLGELADGTEVVIEVGPERASSPAQVDELLATMAAAGFHAYALPNLYGVDDYLRRQVAPTIPRLRRAPVQETDVVFSRTDADELPL